MKTEYRDNFIEFFRDSVKELEKTITVKVYALDYCAIRFKQWVEARDNSLPNYDIKVLTNRQLNNMCH